VESALCSKFPGTRRAGLRTEGGWVGGSRNRTMSRAIPEERFSREGQESRREGEFEDLRPQQPFSWRHSIDTLRRSNFLTEGNLEKSLRRLHTGGQKQQSVEWS
jgi:hypothetical protein